MILREVVYMVLDEIKLISDDSYYNQDHVVFLLGKYRSLVLKKELEKENKPLSMLNALTICIDLEPTSDPDICSETMLKSILKIPSLISEMKVLLFPLNYFFGDNIIYTSQERMRFIGYNKYTQNFIYAAKGPDNYLYLRSSNPLFMYLEKLRMTGVFDDYEEAQEYSCDDDGELIICDKLDIEFPIESALVPIVIELVVKELLGAAYRPKDTVNNANDDLSNLSSKSTKSGAA